jgi:hypothetical protein
VNPAAAALPAPARRALAIATVGLIAGSALGLVFPVDHASGAVLTQAIGANSTISRCRRC